MKHPSLLLNPDVSVMPLSQEDYKEVEDIFLRRFSGHPDVKAVYRFGSVSSPGISDLDYIMVLNEEVRRPNDFEVHSWCQNSKMKYVAACHDLFLVNADIFRHYEWLRPLLNLRLLQGEACPQSAIPIAPRWQAYFLLPELVATYYPETFEISKHRVHSARFYLQALNAFKIPLGMARDLGFVVPTDYAPKVDVLRSVWYEMDSEAKYHMLLELLEYARELSEKMAEHVDRSIANELGEFSDCKILLRGAGIILSIRYRRIRNYSRLGLKLMPLSFVLPLCGLALTNGIFTTMLDCSRIDTQALFNVPDFAVEFSACRIQVANSLYKFLKVNRLNVVHPYAPYKIPNDASKTRPMRTLKKIIRSGAISLFPLYEAVLPP